jgi:hypothetical protein
MTTLRRLAECLNRSGTVSIVHDVLCYLAGLPDRSETSLLGHISALRGRHVHLDVIMVGTEQFNDPARRNLDEALFRTRETYNQVNLGVARVEYFGMSEAEAGDFAKIDSHFEAYELTAGFSGANDNALDVFVVANYDVDDEEAGLAAIDVPCNKDLYKMTGAVLGRSWTGLALDGVTLGQVMAHEIGHLLGLRHVDNVGNLMFRLASGTDLAPSQGEVVRGHCMVQTGCDL